MKEKISKIKKKEWKNLYIKTIADACGDKKFAEECFDAGDDPFWGNFYEGDPVEAAREEMTYWEE